MLNNYKYRRIINFNRFGDLGISEKVIEEIVENTICEIDGVKLPAL